MYPGPEVSAAAAGVLKQVQGCGAVSWPSFRMHDLRGFVVLPPEQPHSGRLPRDLWKQSEAPEEVFHFLTVARFLSEKHLEHGNLVPIRGDSNLWLVTLEADIRTSGRPTLNPTVAEAFAREGDSADGLLDPAALARYGRDIPVTIVSDAPPTFTPESRVFWLSCDGFATVEALARQAQPENNIVKFARKTASASYEAMLANNSVRRERNPSVPDSAFALAMLQASSTGAAR